MQNFNNKYNIRFYDNIKTQSSYDFLYRAIFNFNLIYALILLLSTSECEVIRTYICRDVCI